MKAIPNEERASENSIKALGLERNFQKDILHICNKIRQPNQATKCQILKATAELFHSLGLFTTATLRAKPNCGKRAKNGTILCYLFIIYLLLYI